MAKREFSLNHDAIGTRRSGSFSGEFEGRSEFPANGLEREFQLLSKPGDRLYVGTSVYWARVDNPEYDDVEHPAYRARQARMGY